MKDQQVRFTPIENYKVYYGTDDSFWWMDHKDRKGWHDLCGTILAKKFDWPGRPLFRTWTKGK